MEQLLSGRGPDQLDLLLDSLQQIGRKLLEDRIAVKQFLLFVVLGTDVVSKTTVR